MKPEEMEERIIATVALMLEACRQQGVTVTGDQRVNEQVAAQLIGYTAGTMKKLRQAGGGPAHYRRGAGGSRVSYRLRDLAAWIEKTREKTVIGD